VAKLPSLSSDSPSITLIATHRAFATIQRVAALFNFAVGAQVSSPGRRRYPQTGVAMTEQHEGAKDRQTFRGLLAALHDALNALLVSRPQTLFVTDVEMIRRIGVPEKIARAAIRALDENPYGTFPKKSALWGNRRYWPAVQAWFQEQHDLETGSS
jgi:hypothetical protein